MLILKVSVGDNENIKLTSQLGNKVNVRLPGELGKC